MSLRDLNIDSSWTLFLDRDGVINKMLPADYVKRVEEFEFLEEVPDAIAELSKMFGLICLVTNQRGIGRGIMTHEDLDKVHQNMLNVIQHAGGRIDAVFYCPHDHEVEVCDCRKPGTGMPLQAKERFPQINFSKSIMVGDNLKDVQMGKALGMKTVGIGPNNSVFEGQADFCYEMLIGMVHAFNEG